MIGVGLLSGCTSITKSDKEKLIGVWESQSTWKLTGTWTFMSNGTMIRNGATGTYTIENGTIHFITQYYDDYYGYSFEKDNILIIEYGGSNYTFIKKA
jgi:hypothetical protein